LPEVCGVPRVRKLCVPAVEEGISGNEQRAGPSLDGDYERRIDFVFRAGT
jgi:hypothetical protein